MYVNDGGNFSDDIIARILALKSGSQSENQLAENEQNSKDAVQAGMNMAPAVGSLKLVGPAMEAAPLEMSLADKIREAAAKGKVKSSEGGLTNNSSMYQKGSEFQMDNARKLREGMDAAKKATQEDMQRRNFPMLDEALNKYVR